MTVTPSTHRASFAIGDEHAAKRVIDALTEIFFDGEAAVAAFERPDGRWDVTVHFAEAPDQNLLRELVTTKGVRGQFWDFHELIREIKSSYDPETKTSELQVLEPVVEMDVLLLDDLGAWKMTDWMNDTLFYILNSRYLAKRATLITTNYQDADRERVLAADPMTRMEFLVERIGQRLRSRLMEMCAVVTMRGPDHRRVRQEGIQVAVRGMHRPER